MNDYFRKALTTSRVYLVDNVDYDNLKDFLIEYETLPQSVIENIDSQPNRRQKMRLMLDCLPRRPDLIFSTFLVSLFRSNQSHIASLLYEKTINLIDSTNFQLRELLDTNIKTLLSPTTTTPAIISTNSAQRQLPESNNQAFNVRNWTNPVLRLMQGRQPVEHGVADFDTKKTGQEEVVMEAEESDIFKNSFKSNNSNTNREPCSSSSFENESCSLKKTETKETPTPLSSFSFSQYHNSLVYPMDSSPRGLICIVILRSAKADKQKSNSTPQQTPVLKNNGDKPPSAATPTECTWTTSTTTTTLTTTLECEMELQNLFWKFGFNSCVVELEDLTFHVDKLNKIVLQFSQLDVHDKFNCCAMAWLGFSTTDLQLSKIFSCFSKETCPYLAGKPKLFLIQVPDHNISPTSVLSGVEIPNDALVAVGLEETDTHPGLVTSLIRVVWQQQPEIQTASYSVQEIFNKLQNNLLLRIAVEKSLTKLWMVDPNCKLDKNELITT